MAGLKYMKPLKGDKPATPVIETKPSDIKKKNVTAGGPANFLKDSNKKVVEAGANNFLKKKKVGKSDVA